jgi:hypothetical protein
MFGQADTVALEIKTFSLPVDKSVGKFSLQVPALALLGSRFVPRTSVMRRKIIYFISLRLWAPSERTEWAQDAEERDSVNKSSPLQFPVLVCAGPS